VPKKKLPAKVTKALEKVPEGNPKAKEWLEKIRKAQKVREEWRKTFRVSVAYDYWEGRQRPQNVPDSQWITINLFYSTLITMLPSLYNTDPYFYIKLKRSFIPDPMMIALYEQRGRIRQSMINYLKEELELKEKMRMSIFDAIFQFGIVKIHYEAEMVENPDKGKMVTDEYGMLSLNEKGEPIKEPNEIPASEAYKITRIHPDDFLVDEDAGPLNEDVKWKAQRIKENIKDVRENKKYKKNSRDSVQPTEISDQIQKEREQRKKGSVYASADKEQDNDVVVLWEVWDLKNNEWFTLAEGCNDFMIEPDKVPMGTEDDPFIDLRFTMRDDSWYPLPAASQWIDPQREYCDLRSKLMVHRKRFNRKYTIYMAGLADENEATKLEIGDDGTLVKTNTPGNTIVSPIQDAPLDQNHIQELALLRNDMALLAVGPNQARSGQGVDSATEASIIEKRLQVQEGDWIGSVIDMATKIARKIDQLVKANITRDQAIRVAGPQGEYWELVKSTDYEDIEGEYEYSVNVGATTPKLPEIERAQWIAFLQLLASAPQLALSKRLLKQMSELFHIDDEAMLNEIYSIASQMMSGQLPMPGRQGSSPGSPGLPGTASAGMAMGPANMRGGMGPMG
jgi:hypothetical protein